MSLIVSSFGQIEQGTHLYKKILELLSEKSVSGARSGRASL